MSNRPYLVQMSNKTEVQIDSDELPKVTEGIRTSSPIRLKRGIINPSFIVAVIQDSKRWEEHMGITTGITGSPEWQAARNQRAAQGCRPLSDVFAKTSLAIQPAHEVKQLEG